MSGQVIGTEYIDLHGRFEHSFRFLQDGTRVEYPGIIHQDSGMRGAIQHESAKGSDFSRLTEIGTHQMERLIWMLLAQTFSQKVEVILMPGAADQTEAFPGKPLCNSQTDSFCNTGDHDKRGRSVHIQSLLAKVTNSQRAP